MTLALISSRALAGMEAPEVMVEVHLANGLPTFTIVGLPETEVKESRERVRAAILHAGFEFPSRRITVNLAPADLPKESGRLDLPIALGILAASGQIASSQLDAYEYVGELSLSGELRPVRGALAMTYAVARGNGNSTAAGQTLERGFILPRGSAAEAALVRGARVYAAANLLEVCAHLGGGQLLPEVSGGAPAAPVRYADFADVKGQALARRGLEVAAAGGHSALLIGPPGTGKSMLAQRFPGILPPLSDQEALESAAVLSLAGLFKPTAWGSRVLRMPHHTASAAAMAGGGSNPRPGEISLAHHGVLFLDELPEYPRHVLEVLREPLESGRITVSRVMQQADFPARFQLLAAMNPCPCGYLGHPTRECRCTPALVLRYQNRISGPLLDRIDLRIEVPAMSHEELLAAAPGERSTAMAERVARARAAQLARQNKLNCELAGAELERYCRTTVDGAAMLRTALSKFAWSARSYHRVLKIARSIGDLEGAGRIEPAHVAAAISLRRGWSDV